MLDLELIKQGAKIETRDGRKLIFGYITNNRIWVKEIYDENFSAYNLNGFWRDDNKPSVADIIIINTNFQLKLF